MQQKHARPTVSLLISNCFSYPLSICLPMEARDAWDVTYLVSLILTNGIAFLVIVVCYVSIYYSLGKETRRSEVKISQKMALLVSDKNLQNK